MQGRKKEENEIVCLSENCVFHAKYYIYRADSSYPPIEWNEARFFHTRFDMESEYFIGTG